MTDWEPSLRDTDKLEGVQRMTSKMSMPHVLETGWRDWVYWAWIKENLERKDKPLAKAKKFCFLVCYFLRLSFKATDSAMYKDTLGKGNLLCWSLSYSISASTSPFWAVLCDGSAGNLQPHFSFSRQFHRVFCWPLSTCAQGKLKKEKGMAPSMFSLVSITPEKSFIVVAASDSSL